MICAECGQAITEVRLAAIPGATRCVRCADAPYVRPEPRTLLGGPWGLLADLTEAPIQHELDPERKATERAENTFYRQIEGLEETDLSRIEHYRENG